MEEINSISFEAGQLQKSGHILVNFDNIRYTMLYA